MTPMTPTTDRAPGWRQGALRWYSRMPDAAVEITDAAGIVVCMIPLAWGELEPQDDGSEQLTAAAQQRVDLIVAAGRET